MLQRASLIVTIGGYGIPAFAMPRQKTASMWVSLVSAVFLMARERVEGDGDNLSGADPEGTKASMAQLSIMRRAELHNQD